MYELGDQQKIQQQGFSMLDMKAYMNSRGLQAEGFRFQLDTFAKIRVPGITLVNTNGYRHFIVVKGISNDEVLIADPAAGTGRRDLPVELERPGSAVAAPAD